MKTIYSSLLLIALTAAGSIAYASETSDLFNDRLPKMASENQDQRKNAQQDWMRHCLQNSNNAEIRKEACRLMCDQLAKETPLETKVWLVRQLAYIGDQDVVESLKKAANDNEKRVADEATRALADIAGGEDRNVLRKNANETKMPMAIPYASEDAVADWMKNYDSLDDLAKAQTLANLAVRRDRRYIKQALDGLKSDDAVLRDAAITAVGALGSSREIPVLLDQVFEGGNRDLAKRTLTRMNDRMLDVQLLGRLGSEKDFGRFAHVANILKDRNYSAALPAILEKAALPDSPDRLQLMHIAEPLATKDKVGDFVAVWEKITDRGQKDQAEQVIARLVDGDSAPVTAKRTNANYADMFSLLGRIGDDKSLEEIRNRVFGKSLPQGMTASPELTAAALRAMCNWPNARVANDLIQVVEDQKFSNPEHISALRGYIRVASLPNDRIGINVRERGKVEMLEKAMQLSVRNDEKRLVIQRAGQVRHADSLSFIMRYFDEPQLQEEVCQSVVELAHHTDLRNSAKDQFKSALDKVLETTKDQNRRDRAKRYRDAM